MPKKKYIIPPQPMTEEHFHSSSNTPTSTFPNYNPDIWWSAAENKNSVTGDLYHRFNCKYNNTTGCRATHKGAISKEDLSEIDMEGVICDTSCIKYEYGGEHNHSIEPSREELDKLNEEFQKFCEERKIKKKEKREEERRKKEEKIRNPNQNRLNKVSAEKSKFKVHRPNVKLPPPLIKKITIKLKKDIYDAEDSNSQLETQEKYKKRVLNFLSPGDPSQADVPQLREIDFTFGFLYGEYKKGQNNEAPFAFMSRRSLFDGENLLEVGLDYDFNTTEGNANNDNDNDDMQY